MAKMLWSRVTRTYDLLVVGLLFLAGAMIAVAFAMIIVDVTLRTLGVSPPSFTTATVEYALLYITMFVAPHLVRNKSHVFIDAVVTRLPDFARRAAEKVTYCLAIAASLIFAYIAFGLLVEAIQSGDLEERGVEVPLWLLYWPVPLGFALVAVEFARYLFGADSMYTGRTQAGGSV